MSDIANFVRDLARQKHLMTGIDVRLLLEASLERVMTADERRNGAGVFSRLAAQSIDHVVDWLVASVVNDEPWLKRCNEDGIPLKLAKFGTFQQMVDEADKAMRKRNTRGFTGDAGGEVVYEFRGGWTMVRLRTAEELDGESSFMQHCVGHGGYDESVRDGRTGIYSLRDPHGKAHATVEIDHSSDDVVEQVKGKQNAIPRRDYFARVAEWLNEMDFSFPLGVRDYPPGYAVNSSFKLVDVSALPAGSFVDGSVYCGLPVENGDYEAQILPIGLDLPAGLTIKGDLTIVGQWRHKVVLPEGLKVEGDVHLNGVTIELDTLPGRAVYIQDCAVTRLPRRVSQAITITQTTFLDTFAEGRRTAFEGFACISNSHVQGAIEKMEFGGSLNLDRVSGWIGDSQNPNLEVAGDLKITRCHIKFLDAVTVGGKFVIDQSSVMFTPVDFGREKTVTVGGLFHAHRSHIDRLPATLKVGGEFCLTDVKALTEIPETAELLGNVVIRQTSATLGSRTIFHGDLSISNGTVSTLTFGTEIAGSLYLENLPIERLPTGLRVGGSLHIKGTPVKRIPYDAKIGDDLILRGSYVVAVPDGFVIPGNLDITGHGGFRIGNGVTIGGALLAKGSALATLPADLRVLHVLASASCLDALPHGFAIDGDLDVSLTRISKLPENLYVGGAADLRGTRVSEVPSSAAVIGALLMGDGVDIPARARPEPPTAVYR